MIAFMLHYTGKWFTGGKFFRAAATNKSVPVSLEKLFFTVL